MVLQATKMGFQCSISANCICLRIPLNENGIIDKLYAAHINLNLINHLEYLIWDDFSFLHSCIYDHPPTLYFIRKHLRALSNYSIISGVWQPLFSSCSSDEFSRIKFKRSSDVCTFWGVMTIWLNFTFLAKSSAWTFFNIKL